MKRIGIVAGLVLAFALGAGAYALLPTLFNSTAATAAESGERVMEIAVAVEENGESYGGTVRVYDADPAELPSAPADAAGLFLTRDGNTLTLGTGSISVEINSEQINDQAPVSAVSAVHSGEDVAILVNDATVVYRDTTPAPQPSRAEVEAGNMVLQRTVEPGSLDDLDSNMIVRAWGIMQNGQLVADLLVYETIH